MENKFSSKQVAEETGLSVHTLRYYEQIGLIDGIERDENGYRQYSESDIVWFQALRYFRAMGMPIREIQQFIAMQNREDSTITARRQFVESYRRKVIDQLKELEKTLEKIDHKINFFKRLESTQLEL
ncbi:MerR family transcriptional regulator [Paenibacillus sophorae]|uniref:MerR family transcriptional regulator n=1 Tax=Paenibacillus sophorae TaxID=1333845 RepID=A0ABX8H710_9BACL|nr:MerR family transcriptional regulator [Paenibacillus sophorae]QWU13778.1 MerR family transcriptional regulator [Paenibacillus sophorae]